MRKNFFFLKRNSCNTTNIWSVKFECCGCVCSVQNSRLSLVQLNDEPGKLNDEVCFFKIIEFLLFIFRSVFFGIQREFILSLYFNNTVSFHTWIVLIDWNCNITQHILLLSMHKKRTILLWFEDFLNYNIFVHLHFMIATPIIIFTFFNWTYSSARS